MAVITPQTEIRLVKCPLELSDLNQLTFATATAQYTYFNGLTHVTADNATYQRKDGYIRYPAKYDDIIDYNYVMYQNEAYSNKWFYAFIDHMEYISDGTTAVYIKTDVFQTWQHSITFKNSFVEREHTMDDTIGANTVPEGLEVGDYKIVDLRNIPMYESQDSSPSWMVCFAVTKLPGNIDNIVDEGNTIGSVFTSLHFFAVVSLTAAKNVIKIYEADADLTSDAIVNVYMIPQSCVSYNSTTGNTGAGHTPTTIGNPGGQAALYPVLDSNTEGPFQLQQPTALADSYTPKNKKLYTYPYSYFYITNKGGTDVTFHWEDFPIETVSSNTAPTITYKKAYVPSTSISAKLYFTKYKGHTESTGYGTRLYNYGINYAKVPVCAWVTDYYTNWLTQNGINVGMDLATGLVGAGVGAFAAGMMGGPIGLAAAGAAMMSATNTISDSLGQMHQASTTPDQAHGDLNTGDVMFAYTRNSMSLYMMSVRAEYARIIDDYFSMYGYKTNRVKVPNVYGRSNWNFVKTIGCYIAGDIPQKDMEELKAMLDAGITFWHNPSTFMDYSQTNSIVS